MESEKQAAVLEFYRIGFDPLKKFCMNFCRLEPWLAEDLAQEAFIKAYYKAEQIEDLDKIKTWVYTIAKNECMMHYRPIKNAPGVELSPFREAPEADSWQRTARTDRAIMPDDLVLLKETIGQMAEGYAAILLLHEYEGYSHEEAADILGNAVGTCKSQLHKARAQARRIVETGDKKEKRKTTCNMTFLQTSKK